MPLQLKKVHLTSGEEVEIADGLTVIVGPNNAGKSLFLRELYSHLLANLDSSSGVSKVVQGYNIDFHGSPEDLAKLLDDRGYGRPPGSYPEGTFHETTYRIPSGNIIRLNDIRVAWGLQRGLGVLGPYFALYLGAEGRLGMIGETGGFNPMKQSPTGPVQMMFADRKLESKISGLMKRAFNEPLRFSQRSDQEAGRNSAVAGL